jgi:hypothetical protein
MSAGEWIKARGATRGERGRVYSSAKAPTGQITHRVPGGRAVKSLTKKLVILAVLVALGVIAAKCLRGDWPTW